MDDSTAGLAARAAIGALSSSAVKTSRIGPGIILIGEGEGRASPPGHLRIGAGESAEVRTF